VSIISGSGKMLWGGRRTPLLKKWSYKRLQLSRPCWHRSFHFICSLRLKVRGYSRRRLRRHLMWYLRHLVKSAGQCSMWPLPWPWAMTMMGASCRPSLFPRKRHMTTYRCLRRPYTAQFSFSKSTTHGKENPLITCTSNKNSLNIRRLPTHVTKQRMASCYCLPGYQLWWYLYHVRRS
jgi:hypothetical protein